MLAKKWSIYLYGSIINGGKVRLIPKKPIWLLNNSQLWVTLCLVKGFSLWYHRGFLYIFSFLVISVPVGNRVSVYFFKAPNELYRLNWLRKHESFQIFIITSLLRPWSRLVLEFYSVVFMGLLRPLWMVKVMHVLCG